MSELKWISRQFPQTNVVFLVGQPSNHAAEAPPAESLWRPLALPLDTCTFHAPFTCANILPLLPAVSHGSVHYLRRKTHRKCSSAADCSGVECILGTTGLFRENYTKQKKITATAPLIWQATRSLASPPRGNAVGCLLLGRRDPAGTNWGEDPWQHVVSRTGDILQ